MIKQPAQASVRLTDLISPNFYDLYHDVKNSRHSYYWLSGGRGSTKSSFAAIMIILGMMDDPDANAVILRRVKESMRESVFEQMLWAIDKLQVSHLWHESLNPLSITYIPTGQRILFKGGDKPKKVKASTFRRGHTKFVLYEEVDEFKGMEDVRTINQTLIRGTATTVFYLFNPPRSVNNWTNSEMRAAGLREDTRIHYSDYRAVPAHWLGDQFIRDAEHLKAVNESRYNHEYLGQVTGTGAEVFTNVTERPFTAEELNRFDKVRRGIDFGYAKDPVHYTENYYDKKREKLYIFGEIHKVGMSNRQIAEQVKVMNPLNEFITGDSAEPRTIAELEELGLRIVGAKKGPGSVNHGIKWLQDLNEIIIDPYRCPNTAREFTTYEIEQDHQGNLKSNYPDKDNHAIDAVRYSLEDEMKQNNWLY